MGVLKSPKIYRPLYSFSSIADTESSYLSKNINHFLSNNILDSSTLLPTHAYTITTGHQHNIFIASKLIAHYASLSNPHSSAKIFNTMTLKDTFLWNSIIKAHFSNQNYVQTIKFFSNMLSDNSLPNQFTVPMIASACGELKWLSIGTNIHGLVLKLGLFCSNSAVGSSFVYMYSKCESVEEASLVFDEMPERDVVAWTALVIGLVQNGEGERGLECIGAMHRVGGYTERPNSRTLEGGFQACGDLNALVEGRCLHGFALKCGIVLSHSIQSDILSMYTKCGSVKDANVAFHEVINKDLFSWTSLIGVYTRHGCIYKSFQMFLEMQACGVYPDGMVITCLLSGLSNSMMVYEGKAFHGFILRRDYEANRAVKNSLLSMYCKFGLLGVADKIFDRVHDQEKDSWNLMIIGYEKAGFEMKCVNLFREMNLRGIESDLNSLMSAISSCCKLETIHLGRSIHCRVIKYSITENVLIVNSLINMYGKSGNLTIANRLFHLGPLDTAAWNCLISSYTHNGKISEAFTLFDRMISQGPKPTVPTLVTLLSASAQIASIEKGREIHNYIKNEGLKCNISLSTALLDMYAKCGQIDLAREIFDSMDKKDVISYNVMISCYAVHGDGVSAIDIFRKMEQSNTTPNEITFLALLSACAHSGLVKEGKHLFSKMSENFLVPNLKHYSCMVDLLGRSGSLDEAENLINSMPMAPDGGLWGSLLTACKMHNNVDMGIRVGTRAIETDPENDGYYVIISDLYSSLGMWDEVERVRKVMKDRGVKKGLGWSSLSYRMAP